MAKKKSPPASPFVPVEEQPYSIPENWCWVKLEFVCSGPITDGTHKTPKYCEKTDGVPFVSAKDVTSEYIDWSNVKYIVPDLHQELCKRLAPQKNDILLAKNGTTGVAALVETNDIFDLYVTIAVLRPNIGIILPKFMYRLINSPICKNQFNSHLTGIGVPNLHLRDIKNVSIPLPPLSEQRRIVDRTESLFAKLDEAKEKAQAVVDGFELRKSAILHKAFTGELTERWRKEHGVGLDSWEDTTLSEIVSGFKYGTSEKSTYNNTGMPVLRIPNVGTGTLSFEDMKYLAHNDIDEANQVHENDLLIIRSNGSRDLVGKCAIVPALSRKFAYASFLIRIKPSERILPNYLMMYLNSTNARTQMFKKAKSSAGINNINSQELGSITISVPTTFEQSEIISVLNSLLTKEQQAKEAAEAVLDQIDTMKKAILARAFRGELGTNDPAEEWAGELVQEVLKTEVPAQSRAKAVFIPKELEERLESELERKIIKLYLKSDSATLSIDVLMAVSSKKFEVMDALRNLEQRGIIKKVGNGNYSLVG